jgi:fibronectin-binding autotransporter adhesin
MRQRSIRPIKSDRRAEISFKITPRVNRILFASASTTAILLSSGVNAQTFTWDGGTNDWSNYLAWLSSIPNGIPDSPTAEAIFPTPPGAFGINLGFNTYTVNRLTFQGSATGDNRYAVFSGTLALAGADPTVSFGARSNTGRQLAEITTSATLRLDATTTFNGTDPNSFMIVSGLIHGSGGLDLTGAGTLQLDQANTYTGGTTISGGTLDIRNVNALGSGPISLAGGHLRFTSPGASVFSGRPDFAIDRDGTISAAAGTAMTLGIRSVGNGATAHIGTASDTGTITLTDIGSAGASRRPSFSIDGGTVIAGSSLLGRMFGTFGSFTMAPDTVLELSSWGADFNNLQGAGTIGAIAPLSINGGSFSTRIVGASSITFRGDTTWSGQGENIGDYVVGSGATLTTTSATSLSDGSDLTVDGTYNLNANQSVRSLDGAGNIVLAPSRTLTVSNSASSIFDGVLSGGGSLNKQGISSLVLTNSNTYSGGTTISAGTLQVGNGGSSGAIVGNITNNAALIFDRSDSTTFAQSISGGGTLTKRGPGELKLTGTNNLLGVTTVAGGTLSVDGYLASPSVQVQGGASLTGEGSLVGAVNLQNGSTLAGSYGQTLTMGSLSLATDATLRAKLGGDGSTSLFGVTGNLALNGRLAIDGASDLTGTTSYTLLTYGGTLTSTPLLLASLPVGYKASNFALDTSGGQLTLAVTAAEGQQVWRQGSGAWTSGATDWQDTYGNLISAWAGDTAIFQGGGGTVTVEGQKHASALRFEADGFILASGAAGELVLTDDGDAATREGIRVETGFTATVAAPISGTATLVKDGAGTLNLTGINTYQGGTWLTAGTLAIVEDANLGAASGGLTIDGGSTLQALADLGSARSITLGSGGGQIDSNGHAVAFSGPISGAGALTKLGPGTLTLSGSNTYGGGTTISGGTLIGSATSFGTGGILNNANLLIDQATDAALANGIDGTGTLTKRGSGMLNLTGTGNLTGPTLVEGGRLSVNGSLANSVITVSGGSLGGNGNVGGIVAQSGGMIAPGNSIGVLNVSGNVSFVPGSSYQVEIDAAGQSDRIAATGTATLSGGTVQVLPDQGTGYVANSPYTILTARSGVNGTFAGTTGGEFAFVTPTLGYTSDAVTLTLVRKTNPTDPTDPLDPTDPTDPTDPNNPEPPQPVAFHSVAETRNQYTTADGVEALRAGHRLYDTVLGASVSGARQAFDALSGEAHASAVTVAYEDGRLVREAILTRLRQPLSSGLPTFVQGSYSAAYAADVPQPAQLVNVTPSFDPRRFALWGEGFGSWGKIASNGNAASLDTSTGGFILGADAQVADAFRLGLAGGLTRTSFDIDGRLSSGSNESVFAALFGAGEWGTFALRLGAAYAWHDIDVTRTIRFPGFADTTGTSYDGWTAQAFAEVGYRIGLGHVQLEPFAGASVLRLHTDGFAEEGGAAALTGSAHDQDLATTTLGLRAEAQISQDLPLTLRGLLGWRHAFGDVEPEMLLAFAGGASAFTVAGAPIDRDALVAEAGLDWQASAALSLGIFYSGQIGERAQEHALKGNLVWRFNSY